MSHGHTGFHGKSIEEVVDLRFKEYEMRQRKEKEERDALTKAREDNKADLTAKPAAAAPAPVQYHGIHKLLHKLHFE